MTLHELLVPLLIAGPLIPIRDLDLIAGDFCCRLFSFLLLLAAILRLALCSRSLLGISSLLVILKTLDGIEPLLLFFLLKLFAFIFLCEDGLGRSFLLLRPRFRLEVC
jgi:hypothetical protein